MQKWGRGGVNKFPNLKIEFLVSQVSCALAAPPPTTAWGSSPVSPTRTGVGAGKYLEDHSIQSEPPLKQVL